MESGYNPWLIVIVLFAVRECVFVRACVSWAAWWFLQWTLLNPNGNSQGPKSRSVRLSMEFVHCQKFFTKIQAIINVIKNLSRNNGFNWTTRMVEQTNNSSSVKEWYNFIHKWWNTKQLIAQWSPSFGSSIRYRLNWMEICVKACKY